LKFNKRIDAKLVESYQSGNKEALAKLVKRWHLTFCKKAFWIVKDADIAKDIAQDTWQTIMTKIDSLQDTCNFSGWASRIVYSKSLDVLRKASSERIKQQAYANDNFVTTEEFTNENNNLKKKLLLAIQNLPEQQQIVIKLFYTEDYSLKEISKTLNISIGTAKSRLYYAREKLKNDIKPKK
jgi:RNA polymerase sigma-70 factor (ECF subfamily)